MRFILLIFSSLLLYSCSTKNQEKQLRNLSPLSEWLVKNEDSMYQYVRANLKSDDIDWKNTSYSYTEHVIPEGQFKTLQDTLNKNDSLVRLYILRNATKDTILYTLLFSTDYIQTNSTYLDSLFNDINSLKHFKIQKYRQAESLFSEFINEDDKLKENEIKFHLKKVNSKYDLTLITKKHIQESTKYSLLQNILGEKVLLKQINNIKYNIPVDNHLETKTIEELRIFFNIKND